MKALDIALIAFAVGLTAFTLLTFSPSDTIDPGSMPLPFSAIVLHDGAHPVPAHDGPAPPPFPWHFLVNRDGTIARGYLWRDRLPNGRSGIEDLDRTSLSICIAGDLDHSPPTRAQCREMVNLLDRLCREMGIGPEQVMTHAEMHPGKACPGKGLPAEAVREALRRRRAGLTEAPRSSSVPKPGATRS